MSSSHSCILGDKLLGRLELFKGGRDQLFLERALLGHHFCSHSRESETPEWGQAWGDQPSTSLARSTWAGLGTVRMALSPEAELRGRHSAVLGKWEGG